MAEEKKDNTARIDQKKQDRLKAKTEVENKDDQIKNESPKELRSKLSNKNTDYVFRLQKELEKQGNLSTEEAVEKVDKLLPEIVIAQRHGQPANGLFMASPMIKAGQILHPEVKPKTMFDIPFWQRGVDNALLWIAIFMAMYGILGAFQTKDVNEAGQNGILTIIIIGGFLGVFMAKYNEVFMPRTVGQKPKIQWPKLIIMTLILVVAILVLVSIFNIKQLRVINPVLPSPVYIILAVVIYGARWLFRKKYDITVSAFGPSVRR